MEVLLTLEFWLVTTIGGFISFALGKIYPKLVAAIQSVLRHSKSSARLWYYRRVKRKLLRIQEANRDELIAHRDVALSSAYHQLFIAAIAAFPFMVISALVLMPDLIGQVFWAMMICSVPIYAFELVWLSKSKFLDDLIRYRKRAQDRAARKMTNASMPAPVKQSRLQYG